MSQRYVSFEKNHFERKCVGKREIEFPLSKHTVLIMDSFFPSQVQSGKNSGENLKLDSYRCLCIGH